MKAAMGSLIRVMEANMASLMDMGDAVSALQKELRFGARGEAKNKERT